jgi:hypothetical protein
LSFRSFGRLLDQIRCDINAGHVSSRLCGRNREIARTRRNIENLSPRFQIQPFNKLNRAMLDRFRDLTEVAGDPHTAEPVLKSFHFGSHLCTLHSFTSDLLKLNNSFQLAERLAERTKLSRLILLITSCGCGAR